MFEDKSADKVARILDLYTKLMNGSIVNKKMEAQLYGVNERSIQRDINDIRDYLENDAASHGYVNSIIYDRDKKGYRLEQIYRMKLTNSEILAVCKILLDSRAFTKREMDNILERLLACCVPEENRKMVTELVSNEQFHYVEPHHGKVYLDKMWDLGQAIRENRYIEIQYQGIQGTTVKTRKLKPLAIMFSEFYFYLAAFIDDEKVRENFNVLEDSFPTIYRIDRIQGLKVLEERFHIPYSSRFEEGEFRKRIQFMFGGKLRKIKFEYSGYSIEAILDRLPTAKIISVDEGKYVVQAEVFGDGVDMWLRCQGEKIKVL